MPIREDAINSALAEVLTSSFDVHATAEQTRKKTGLKRCDVQIRHRHGDRYFTAVECKIGQDSSKQKSALEDTKRWLKEADCLSIIALCYPEEISLDSKKTPGQKLETSSSLLMAKVNHAGVIGKWHSGPVADLVKLASDTGANETYAVTDILQRAITVASEQIDASTGKDLSGALELPWDPGQGDIDLRPARIACLILANTALLQNRMHSQEVRIPDLEPLVAIRSAPNKQVTLLDNWKRIRKVDYAPVIDPAILVLELLPSDHSTENLLEILIEAVLKCAPRIRGFQLDHAGPLYHELLQTARYDGSFYTSTAASVLLAELAMPNDWYDWSDTNRIDNLKICDPACGTGTLLMASARTIEERCRAAGGGDEEDLALLHLSLIENVLHGFDINRHAIHLAASMLTLSAPKIDYNKMNLYNMQHGVNASGEVRAGSLDILVDDAGFYPGFFPGFAPEISQRRATAIGYQQDAPDLEKQCDLVIMNPPFTRNDIRNRSLPDSDRKKVQKHEKDIVLKISDMAHKKAIDQTTVFSFFAPIADRLLSRTGTIAVVQPFTSCTAPAATGHRDILTDPDRFHVEVVVTSHDNRRIYFSENTNIHESLVIARRPTPETKNKPTAFISLAENPASASDAHFLAEAIQQALSGDQSLLADFGTIAWRSYEQVRNHPWNAAAFYMQDLVEVFDSLLDNKALVPLGRIATLTDGRRTRGIFGKSKKRQNPDVRALWDHKSSRQTTMRTSCDSFLVAKKGKHNQAGLLWQKRSNLLVVNRMRLNLAQTPAVFSNEAMLGSAFVPVLPDGENKEQLCKAWCAWLNSTLGILCFLNFRQKNLTYPNFSMDSLKSLPVPHPDYCDVSILVHAFDKYADNSLKPLPEIHVDPIRHALDEAVASTIPDLPVNLHEIRQTIAREPTVNNKKEQFHLE